MEAEDLLKEEEDNAHDKYYMKISAINRYLENLIPKL